MCASCGCGKFQDDHGDDRHITLRDLEEAAEASDITVQEVMENLREAAGSRQEASTRSS
jgi:hypothetical protein